MVTQHRLKQPQRAAKRFQEGAMVYEPFDNDQKPLLTSNQPVLVE